MTFELLFAVILVSVFFISARKEKKARIILNGISGILSLIIVNSLFPVNIGYNLFSLLMAFVLGFPAVGAMALVKIL